jgi:glycosyltransferase involved in cell wall biosynthesis
MKDVHPNRGTKKSGAARTSDDDRARREGITITGRYNESEVFDLIAAEQPDIIFLPSIWPETYSYTLSIAMACGLPIAVFDIGAQAERLRMGPGGRYAATPRNGAIS